MGRPGTRTSHIDGQTVECKNTNRSDLRGQQRRATTDQETLGVLTVACRADVEKSDQRRTGLAQDGADRQRIRGPTPRGITRTKAAPKMC